MSPWQARLGSDPQTLIEIKVSSVNNEGVRIGRIRQEEFFASKKRLRLRQVLRADLGRPPLI